MVQSEGGEILNTDEISQQIALVEADTTSSSLKQVDEHIAQLQKQLHSTETDIAHYQQLRAKRENNYLNRHERRLFRTAQSSQQALSKQLLTLTQTRLTELNAIRQRNDARITALKDELAYRIQKG